MEVGVVLLIGAVLGPDHPRQVVVRAGPQEEVGHLLPIHQFADQATEALRVTDPGLSLALAEDQDHAQGHEMTKDHENCINTGLHGRRLIEDQS